MNNDKKKNKTKKTKKTNTTTNNTNHADITKCITNTWHSPKRPPFCGKLCYYLLNQ